MAETLTANYAWTKPDPGASANTWGATLNADLDKIDVQVFANQTALGNVLSGATHFTSLNVNGPVNATGNISGAYLYSAGNINAVGTIQASGNINANGTIIANGEMVCTSFNCGGPATITSLSTGEIDCSVINASGAINAVGGISSQGAVYAATALDTDGVINAGGNITINPGSGNAFKPGGGPWLAVSDARLKTVEAEYKPGLDVATRLRPVVYHYNANPKRSFVGLVADEVLPFAPEMVEVGEGVIDGREVDDLKTLDTGPLLLILINAVKELKAEVEALKAK